MRDTPRGHLDARRLFSPYCARKPNVIFKQDGGNPRTAKTPYHCWLYPKPARSSNFARSSTRGSVTLTPLSTLHRTQSGPHQRARRGWNAITCLFLDGLQLIHDNYPSSIPVFYSVLYTVGIFLGYGKINSVRSDFLEYPIQYKKVGYSWGNCHESTVIHPRTSM
jgi:hypothetical protein